MRDDWMKGYPSVVITRSIKGDREYALLFYGEGNKLLYQLKNLMKFNDLGQDKMTRLFTDGTVIIASSVFGHDKIIIDVTKSIAILGIGRPSCVITLIDFPTVIPPMWNPGEILPDDIVDKDYISTYFIIDISKCSTCDTVPAWTFSYEFTSPTGYEYYDDDPNDHLIYSSDGLGYGEAIEKGYDSSGQYALWKVYTEGVDMSRTGYGFIKVTISVVDRNTGLTICSEERVVKVDCCEKELGERTPIIYWEYCTESIWCQALDEISNSILVSFESGGWILFGLKVLLEDGGCIPYNWTLEGNGELILSGDFNQFATYKLSYADFANLGCKEPVIFSVTDRCGTQDTLELVPCCDGAVPLEIGYTTLAMSCGGVQTFCAAGGCPPYSWSSSGGGTLVESEDHGCATYYAPETNLNCTSNGNVTVTDCCGSSANVQIAVNCWTEANWAYRYSQRGICEYEGETCISVPGPPPTHAWIGYGMTQIWTCYGALICSTGDLECDFPYQFCFDETEDGCMSCLPSFGPDWCAGTMDAFQTEKFIDLRDEALLALGCCPLNPITGLPF